MGQSQSKTGHTVGGAVRPGAGTPEPEAKMDPEERARLQAEERERRAAAAQQRLAGLQKKKGAMPSAAATSAPKKKSALEQMSAENRGWRAADEQADLRAWN